MEALVSLNPVELEALAALLRSGRLTAPFFCSGVERVVSASVATEVARDLQELADNGLNSVGLAMSLKLLASGLKRRPCLEDILELVTTGPEAQGVTNRDTSVVVQELFRRADRSVLIAGFRVYQGQQVFQTLADRMLEVADLKVRMFLDIERGTGDTTSPDQLVARFRAQFRSRQWPQDRPLPEIFFDPRSLETDRTKKGILHAKCVVVDGTHVFVSSANFTEAAQERNVEVGLLLHSTTIGERITRFFEAMTDAGHLHRVI